MHQGEEHGAHGGQPGPAVIGQQGVQLVKIAHVGKAPLGHVGHDDDGDDDLIGRKAEDEGHQNGAVQAQQAAKGIEKLGAMGQEAHIPHRHVGHHPDNQSRRRGHRRGPAQHEQRAVEDGADDDLSHLGRPVGRQLQREGGGHPLENGFRQQTGDQQGHAHAQQDDQGQPQGREEGGGETARRTHEEHGDDGDQGGKPAVAGDEVVGYSGDEPLSRRIDDAAAHHAGGVAAEAHAHNKGNLCY